MISGTIDALIKAIVNECLENGHLGRKWCSRCAAVGGLEELMRQRARTTMVLDSTKHGDTHCQIVERIRSVMGSA